MKWLDYHGKSFHHLHRNLNRGWFFSWKSVIKSAGSFLALGWATWGRSSCRHACSVHRQASRVNDIKSNRSCRIPKKEVGEDKSHSSVRFRICTTPLRCASTVCNLSAFRSFKQTVVFQLIASASHFDVSAAESRSSATHVRTRGPHIALRRIVSARTGFHGLGLHSSN